MLPSIVQDPSCSGLTVLGRHCSASCSDLLMHYLPTNQIPMETQAKATLFQSVENIQKKNVCVCG